MPAPTRKLVLMTVPVAAAMVLFAWLYLTRGRYQSTDDASLQAAQVAITANVGGKVVGIDVHENQPVQAGAVLFRIDPESFQTAVDEAEAQLEAARADVRTLLANYDQAQSEQQAAKLRLSHARSDADRKKRLLAIGVSSQSQYDEAVLSEQTAEQSLAAAHARSESVRVSLAGDLSVPIDDYPTVRRARAAVERARIALKDTVVRAPQDGVVTRVHQLQVGDYVSVARPVFFLMGSDVWVQADFKESQLRNMRRGQSADVTIDAYPGSSLKAHVSSFSPGTGSSFDVLPAENATGNWIKVVQRLPVELQFDTPPPELALHAGLSAEVRVDTESGP